MPATDEYMERHLAWLKAIYDDPKQHNEKTALLLECMANITATYASFVAKRAVFEITQPLPTLYSKF